MTTIDDLGYQSLTDMTRGEGIERIMSIRASRRVPVKKSKKTTRKSKKQTTPKVSAEQAAQILELLGG